MPHWSEPGSGEKPDGGERPDPPEIDATTLGRSRLFPQLPDDPHLVDTSDTGLMDAVRSDTVPTVSPGTEEELFDTGPLSVEDSTQTIGQTSDANTHRVPTSFSKMRFLLMSYSANPYSKMRRSSTRNFSMTLRSLGQLKETEVPYSTPDLFTKSR